MLGFISVHSFLCGVRLSQLLLSLADHSQSTIKNSSFPQEQKVSTNL